MRTTFRLFLLVILLLAGFAFAPAGPAQAESLYPPCLEGSTQLTGSSAGGALWFICVPPVSAWNGALVIYAHGYESPVDPANWKAQTTPTFANLTNPVDGTYLPFLLESQGFAFGATTYRRTGLVAADGVEDVVAVAEAALDSQYPPLLIYVAGVSEGGLVTTLAVEKHPELFAGGLATCGPIGDFQKQINYFGDFRALYDYFFPDILPGNATNIPTALVKDWPDKFEARALGALSQNPGNALQLVTTSQAAIDPAVPETIGVTTSEVLWYNVFSMMNAKEVLGGNPFDNKDRVYAGSTDDNALNLGVRRYAASPTALANVGAYQTTGQLAKPLVTLHTTLDPVVPFWHEAMYGAKVGSNPNFMPISVVRYGHCNFNSGEITYALGVLLRASGGQLANQ